MPRTFCVSRPGICAEIEQFMLQAGKRWQTASLIGIQMFIPPEALYREAAQSGGRKPVSAGASISKILHYLVTKNILERRRNEVIKRWEFRILKQK
jgi:hypothetical protein